MLRKPPSRLEVLNDKDEEVVNFFRVLRGELDRFVRTIQLTPFSRRELDQAFQWADDPFERARRFYVRSWQARGGPRARWRTGWRYQRSDCRGTTTVEDWTAVGHLWDVVERLRNVQMECDDFEAVIARYDAPETLYYLDPPYLLPPDSRWIGKAYTCSLDEAGHRRLRDVLEGIQGMAIVSGYPSRLYDELYRGWEVHTKHVRTDTGKGVEGLWLSPAVARARLPLFEMAGVEVGSAGV